MSARQRRTLLSVVLLSHHIKGCCSISRLLIADAARGPDTRRRLPVDHVCLFWFVFCSVSLRDRYFHTKHIQPALRSRAAQPQFTINRDVRSIIYMLISRTSHGENISNAFCGNFLTAGLRMTGEKHKTNSIRAKIDDISFCMSYLQHKYSTGKKGIEDQRPKG